MHQKHVIVDVETVRNADVPYTGEEKPGFVLAAPHHKVVVLGSLLLDGEAGDFKPLGYRLDADERAGVARFDALISARDVQLVTFAGRGFDVPVIAARAFHYGIPLERLYRRGRESNLRNRYDDSHLDLMDELSERGAGTRPRLDAFARLAGFPGKTGVSGGDVARLVEEGRIEEVATYCFEDLVTTAAVFLRWKRLTGELDAAGYGRAARYLRDFVHEEERLTHFSSCVDWAQFYDVELSAGERSEDATPASQKPAVKALGEGHA